MGEEQRQPTDDVNFVTKINCLSPNGDGPEEVQARELFASVLRACALQSLRLPLRVFCFLSASLAREYLVLSIHDERGASQVWPF